MINQQKKQSAICAFNDISTTTQSDICDFNDKSSKEQLTSLLVLYQKHLINHKSISRSYLSLSWSSLRAFLLWYLCSSFLRWFMLWWWQWLWLCIFSWSRLNAGFWLCLEFGSCSPLLNWMSLLCLFFVHDDYTSRYTCTCTST